MNIGKIISGAWRNVQAIWLKLTGKAKKVLPLVIETFENIKNFQDNGTVDALTAVIPGTADDKLAEGLRKWIPILLRDLHLVDDCLHLPQNEMIKCGFAKLRLSSDHAKDILFHGIVSKLMELTSEGTLKWKDIVGGVAEFLYQTLFKKRQVG